MKAFVGRREQKQGSYTGQKSRLVIAKLPSFGGVAWVRQAEDLTSADQVNPEWFKISFLGELEV